MSNHLSEDQFARCIVGQPTRAALQHTAECLQCRAELERFSSTLSVLRRAIRKRIDDQVGLLPSSATRPSIRPVVAGMSVWRWALGAVSVVVFFLGMVPFFTGENEPQEVPEQVSAAKTNPDAIMNAMNLHLSRTVPAAMEPMMSLLPEDESITESGGVQ